MPVKTLRRPEPADLTADAAISAAGLRVPRPDEVAITGRRAMLAPSEDILLTTVDLPMASRRQRAAAVGFAVEDVVAESLDDVHVVLGPEITRGRHLACVMRHDRMAAWNRALAGTAHGRCRILPDALAVPRPAPGRWNMRLSGDRVVVRTPDGGGFAGRSKFTLRAWEAAERPDLLGLGERWPGGPELSEPEPGDLVADSIASRLDLRTGPYAREDGAVGGLARRGAVIAGLAIAAKLGVMAYDADRLNDLYAQRSTEAAALLLRHAPDLRTAPDTAAALLSLLPRREITRSGRILHVVSEMSAALDPDGEGVALGKLRYSAAEGSLTLSVTAADLSALQRIEQRFTAAGLTPSSGAATAREGAAEAVITLTDPAVAR